MYIYVYTYIPESNIAPVSGFGNTRKLSTIESNLRELVATTAAVPPCERASAIKQQTPTQLVAP